MLKVKQALACSTGGVSLVFGKDNLAVCVKALIMCLTSTDLAMSPSKNSRKKPKIAASIECLPHTKPMC